MTTITGAGRPDREDHHPSTAEHELALVQEGRLPADPTTEADRRDRRDPVDPNIRASIRVGPDGDLWSIRFSGGAQIALVQTKKEAMTLARAMARKRGVSVIEHNANGQVARSFRPRAEPGDQE